MNPVVLPDALRAHPYIDQWLRATPDGRVKAFSGKVDIGQGISHALRLSVAEELGLPPALIDMVAVSTAHSPDEGVTSGSLSVQHSGAALRHAAAALRERCRVAFARQQGVDVAAIHFNAGRFQLRGAEIAAGYADLVNPELLRPPMEAAEAPTFPRVQAMHITPSVQMLPPRSGDALSICRTRCCQTFAMARCFARPGCRHCHCRRPPCRPWRPP